MELVLSDSDEETGHEIKCGSAGKLLQRLDKNVHQLSGFLIRELMSSCVTVSEWKRCSDDTQNPNRRTVSRSTNSLFSCNFLD